MRASVAGPLAGTIAGATAEAVLRACVHCGMCNAVCPTFQLTGDELDGPRGRIYLMKSALEGEDVGPESLLHLDRCLGCRACETACPSGVPYGHLLEATRATLAEHRPIPFVARTILAVFERPRLLGAAMALGRAARAVGLSRLLARLPGRAGFAMAMLESTRRAPQLERVEHSDQAGRAERVAAARGDARVRGSAALLTGCVMEGLFAETNRATERVLRANGYAPSPVAGQVCCGALHVHAGDADAARRLARANIAAFEAANTDYIVVNAAGCGAVMKDYGHLLAGDREWSARAAAIAAKVRDVSELLAGAGTPGVAPGGEVRARVAYDAPCHLLHAQRVASPPLELLRAIPGIQLVPLVESEMCCGSAGIYNLVEPDTSDAVLDRKLGNIAAAGPELVATGNPGCLMQIGAGLLRHGSSARAVHPVDLLDASYRAQ
jgi:glycolate oxidase iron-sulfur subunit